MNLENKQSTFVNQLSIEGCMHSWGNSCSHMLEVTFSDGTIQRGELEGSEILKLIKSVAHENIHFQRYHSSFDNKDYYTHFSHRDTEAGECQKELEVFGKKIVPKKNECYEKLKAMRVLNAPAIHKIMLERDEKFVSITFNCCKEILNKFKERKKEMRQVSREEIFEFSLELEAPLLRAYFLIFRKDILFGQTDSVTFPMYKIISLSQEIIAEVNFILKIRCEPLGISDDEDMKYYIKEESGKDWDVLRQTYPKPKNYPSNLIDKYQFAVTKFLG
ncbi:MAG: hypothetical protein AAGG81_04275 [Chlamydiota bacterium]